MEQGLLVIQGQMHHRQLQTQGRKVAVGQPHRRQGLHPGLLQPGQIGAMPHHAGMVGVLGQHPALQQPPPGLIGLYHGVHGCALGPINRP